MINQLLKKIFIIMCVIVSFGITIPAIAQTSPLLEGSTIERIYTLQQENGALIRIKGTLNKSQLNQISIDKTQGSSFTVTIPNALKDPKGFKLSPSRLVTIETKDQMVQKGDAAEFQVHVEVTSQKEYDISIDNLNTSFIDIKLVDRVAIEQKLAEEAKQAEEAEKAKIEEQAREMAMQEQEQEQIKQEQTQTEGKQTVDEMLRKFRRPSIMQLSIINASGWQKRAYNLSVYLGKEKLKEIEESLGIKLDIVNISNAKDGTHAQSTIYFRDNFLKPALTLARLIPGEQRLVPIDNEQERLGVDIEIYLGKDYK